MQPTRRRCITNHAGTQDGAGDQEDKQGIKGKGAQGTRGDTRAGETDREQRVPVSTNKTTFAIQVTQQYNNSSDS